MGRGGGQSVRVPDRPILRRPSSQPVPNLPRDRVAKSCGAFRGEVDVHRPLPDVEPLGGDAVQVVDGDPEVAHDLPRHRVVAIDVRGVAVRLNAALGDGRGGREDRGRAALDDRLHDRPELTLVLLERRLIRVVRIIRVPPVGTDPLQVVQAEVEVHDVEVAAIEGEPVGDLRDALGGPLAVALRTDHGRLIVEASDHGVVVAHGDRVAEQQHPRERRAGGAGVAERIVGLQTHRLEQCRCFGNAAKVPALIRILAEVVQTLAVVRDVEIPRVHRVRVAVSNPSRNPRVLHPMPAVEAGATGRRAIERQRATGSGGVGCVEARQTKHRRGDVDVEHQVVLDDAAS